MSTRDFEILLIESNASMTDKIIHAFKHSTLSLSFAEAKSLIRSTSLITSEKINFVIFGPSLTPTSIEEFIKKYELKYKLPCIYLYSNDLPLEIETLLSSGIAEAVPFPFDSQNVDAIFDKALMSFKSKSILNLDTDQLKSSKMSKARQVALILDRLSARLAKVSDALKKIPIQKDLVDISIPDAVNKVILGATQFRKEKEEEDLEKLISVLLKSKK